jgi:hypothetical protein
MKTYSITICFFYLFGMAAAYQNTEDVIRLDEPFADVIERENNRVNLEQVDIIKEVDVFESPVEDIEESPTQRYMRGSDALEDKEDAPKRELVAKGTTYIAAKGGAYVGAKGGTYVAAKGTNTVPVTTNYYVYTQEKKKPRRYYGKGKGGGYYGGYGSYYDSYGYSGYGGYGGGYYGY